MKTRAFNPVLKNLLKGNSTFKKELNLLKHCYDYIEYLFIVINVNGEIVTINQEGAKILGYNEDDLIDQNIFKKVIQKNEIITVKSTFDKIITGKISSDIKLTITVKHKNGDHKVIESKLAPIKDADSKVLGILISGNEISEVVEYNQKLQHSYSLYKTLTENLPEINLYLFNANLTFLIADGNDMKRHGFTNKRIKGKNISDVWDEELRSILIPFFHSAIKGKDISTEFDYNNTNYYLWVSPIRNEDNIICAGAALIQNITAEKTNIKKLNEAKEKAENASKSKSEFLTNITHEIRTPLNAIIGFAEQLLKSDLTESQKSYAEIIDKSSEHLLSLVNDLLVLSKIEAGKLRFESVPFKIENIIKEIYNSLKIKAEEKQINFKYDVHEELKRVIVGDTFRLKQILINILSNALKFTSTGYVELKTYPLEIGEKEVRVRIDIIDTGPGIPKKRINAIFDQYRQADSMATNIYGGTGLGLTISKKLTELQGGKITVQSEEGVGTQFTLILPYKLGDEDHIIQHETDLIISDKLKNITVLLVDDDSVNRQLGKIILEDFGCIVDIAIDGREAIKKIEMKDFDIILLDILMPDINGYEVADYIRKNKKDNKVLIIAVTAAVLKEDILKFKKAGINDYLIKPYREINLYNKMCKVLHICKKSVQLSKTEIILKEEEQEPLYNLYELKRVTKGDKKVFAKMVKTFIKNSLESIDNLNTGLENKSWRKIGETAHKMIPSYKHLEIKTIVTDLIELKNKTLITPEYADVPVLIQNITKYTKEVINLLEQEITKPTAE